MNFGYELASGEPIPLTLEFYGKGYTDGHYARDDSQLRITAQDSTLWRSLKQIASDMSWTGLDVPEHTYKNRSRRKSQ